MSRSHITKVSSPVSCGILELGNLQAKPRKNAWEIANGFYHPAYPSPETFLLISDCAKDTRSKDMVEFFVDKSLASLTETETVINPKSGTSIKIWILTVHHVQFKQWYVTEAALRLKRSV